MKKEGVPLISATQPLLAGTWLACVAPVIFIRPAGAGTLCNPFRCHFIRHNEQNVISASVTQRLRDAGNRCSPNGFEYIA
jgi:hypothetical protein